MLRTDTRHRLFVALQIAVIAGSLALLLAPGLRPTALKPVVLGLYLLMGGIDLYTQHRLGHLRLTPGQIYQRCREGTMPRSSPLLTLAVMLGTIVMIVA